MSHSEERKQAHRAVVVYLAIFLGLAAFVWGNFVLHRHGQHYFPLGERLERFGDLVRFTGKFQYGVDPRMQDHEHLLGTLYPRNYPAFGAVLYLFLLQVCAPYAVLVMLGVFFGAMLTACVMLWRRVRTTPGYSPALAAAIFLTGMLGWGSLQVAMRGNLEGWDWILTCLGVWLFSRGWQGRAGIALGMATALKPYPVLWLLLMARQRQWKGVAAGVLSCIVTTLGSLLVFNRNPLVAWRQINQSDGRKDFFFTHYIVAFRPFQEMMGEHSLLQTFKSVARFVRNHGVRYYPRDYGVLASDPLAIKLYHVYLPVAALICLLVLIAVWNKPVLNQMFAIAVVSTALPLVSGDYTLTVVLIPMGFLAILLAEDVPLGRCRLSLTQMLWILVPCAFVMGTVPLGAFHNIFKSLSLLALLASTSLIPLPSARLDDVTRRSEVAHGDELAAVR